MPDSSARRPMIVQVARLARVDLELSRFATPSLSAVVVDREEQGRAAMERLIALVPGGPTPQPVRAPLNQLVLRESTGPAPGWAPRSRSPERVHGPGVSGSSASAC